MDPTWTNEPKRLLKEDLHKHIFFFSEIRAQPPSYLFSRREDGPTGPKSSAAALLLYQTQSKRELIKALCIRARMHEHCLAVMDGFEIWRYYFPSFLETNWTFIAYILKIIQSSREADVSFIEAHREVRSHRINFPVLLLPQEDVWKMPAPLNWFRNEFITWGGFSNFVGPSFVSP